MRSRLGVILAVYCVHLALALAFAWPLARLVADAALNHPRGDLVLFEPGATYLLESFRLGRASLTSVAEGSVFAILMVSYLGLLPLAALIYALAHSGKAMFATLVAAAGRFFGNVLASSRSLPGRDGASRFRPTHDREPPRRQAQECARRSQPRPCPGVLSRDRSPLGCDRGGRSRSGARRGGVPRAAGASGRAGCNRCISSRSVASGGRLGDPWRPRASCW